MLRPERQVLHRVDRLPPRPPRHRLAMQARCFFDRGSIAANSAPFAAAETALRRSLGDHPALDEGMYLLRAINQPSMRTNSPRSDGSHRATSSRRTTS